MGILSQIFIHTTCREPGVITWVQFLESLPPKIWDGKKTVQNFSRFLTTFDWSRISPNVAIVGIFSPNFFRPRDELWSTNEKVTARIHPNCSYSVSWRKSICQVVLFGVIHQLPLLREEFRLSKFTLHSDLRRRAASRLALPCTSSFLCTLHHCLGLSLHSVSVITSTLMTHNYTFL